MAWEWSHTPEAYAYAQDRVSRLTKRVLLEILGEWQYHDQNHADDDTVPSFDLPTHVRKLHRDTLVDLVWSRAEEHRTCTNGGWECYVCPDGCHTVPFGPKER